MHGEDGKIASEFPMGECTFVTWKGAVASECTGKALWISQSDPLCEGTAVAETSEEDVFGVDI